MEKLNSNQKIKNRKNNASLSATHSRCINLKSKLTANETLRII